MIEFFNRLGDRVNPIVVKEMRQAVSSRFVAWSLIVFLTVEVITMTAMVLLESQTERLNLQNMRMGREVFSTQQAILLVSCMVLIPVMTGGRLAGERSDVNVDLLFISSLSPRQIISGKLIAAIALALLIFSACAPFMTFAYLLRGLDMPSIAIVLVSDFFIVCFGTMFALLLASLPVSRGLKIVIGLAGAIFTIVMSARYVELSLNFLRREADVSVQSSDFWLGFAGILAGLLGFVGLMFFWAIALISPPTSNRALPVRLYTFTFWLISGVCCVLWSIVVKEPVPVYYWGLFGTVLFVFQMLIATSERDDWGPRVKRWIPRKPAARIPAFLFYSGTAGGYLFGVLGCTLSVSGMYFWDEFAHQLFYVSARSHDDEMIEFTGLLAGYSYCYGMTAMVVRSLVRKTSFPSSATWLIALIIFGLCSIVPSLIDMMFFPQRYSYQRQDLSWLYLPNAVVTIRDVMSKSKDLPSMTVLFLSLWGITVTAINFRWISRQFANFRPLAKKVELVPDGEV